MQKSLSLPPNLIDSFHQLEEVNHTDWFCTSDPVGSKLGSGGGTTWLLQACHQAFAPEETFSKWIGNEKKILLHAGGQSRRLPGYAPSGKILTPYRFSVGREDKGWDRICCRCNFRYTKES